MESDNMSELKKVKLSEIDDFNNHPFKVIKDNSFYELVDSIKENGLLTPIIVRRKESGRYELISGHRRKLALEVLGILESEVEIRNLDNDEATILMVDSNLYRNNILPSEKAFAYKMKLEAIKHQGKKKPLLHNLCQSYLHPG
jgi:ParB family chromosome partitioning protein